jgi:hypothetical protein
VTGTAPEKRQLHTAQSIGVGVLLTLVTIASSWLIVGKGWLQASGENARQISVNAQRLTILETDRITRFEHNELIARLVVLEQAVPTRAEVDARDKSKDAMLESLTRQVHDMTLQIGALKEEIVSVRGMLEESRKRERP